MLDCWSATRWREGARYSQAPAQAPATVTVPAPSPASQFTSYLHSKLFLFDCLRLLWISGMKALERHRQLSSSSSEFIHDLPFTIWFMYTFVHSCISSLALSVCECHLLHNYSNDNDNNKNVADIWDPLVRHLVINLKHFSGRGSGSGRAEAERCTTFTCADLCSINPGTG